MNVNVKISAQKANQMIGRKEKGISKVLPSALRKNLIRARNLAKRWAPYDKGDTQRGILTPRVLRTPKGATGVLDWRELNSRRKASFQRSKSKYKDFLTWMHKSKYARTFNWHGKSPLFFDIAKKNSEKNLRRDIIETLKKI